MPAPLGTAPTLLASTPDTHSRAPRWLHALLRTEDDWLLTILRLSLGLVMFPHGAQKAFGWFGGGGFAATMEGLTSYVGLPAAVALLVIVAELLGSLGLIFGALGRAAALAIGAVMVGAIVLVHRPHGFFMNWLGTQAGEGYEYHLLVLGIAATLVIAGSGRFSLDRLLAGRLAR